MIILGSILAACLMGPGGAGPILDDKAKAIADEQAKFKGSWKYVSMEIGGTALPKATFAESRLILEGNKFIAKSELGELPGTFEIDPTKKPKTIDISLPVGQGKVAKMLGIYELEGDIYKIASAPEAEGRPTSFASKPGTRGGLQVMERVKP